MNTLQKAAGGMTLVILCGVGIAGYKILHPPTRSFAPFAGVTRVKIYDAQGNATVINNPSHIARICAFVNRYPNKWGGSGDVFGVPVPVVKADFSTGQVFLGHFGDGTNFFETQRDGDFCSHPASADEVSAFRKLVGGAGEFGR